MKEYYWIYILKLSNGHYYTGYTNDLVSRYKKHISGSGSKITRSFKPVGIFQCWQLFEDKGIALRVEAFIKSRDRRRKEFLVHNPSALKALLKNELNLNIKINVINPEKMEKELKDLFF